MITGAKNPGIIIKRAAKANAAPDIISYIGISFFTNWLKPDFKALKPANFAKYTPVIAVKKIKLLSRIDTVNEIEYYKNGGILQFVLRNMI